MAAYQYSTRSASLQKRLAEEGDNTGKGVVSSVSMALSTDTTTMGVAGTRPVVAVITSAPVNEVGEQSSFGMGSLNRHPASTNM